MPTRQTTLTLLGVRNNFALFADTRSEMTVITNVRTLDVFDPQPLPTVDLLLWDEPDPTRVPTECYDLAAASLCSTEVVNVQGTDVVIAAAPASQDKRTFAIPKAVRAEAAHGLRLSANYGNGVSPVALNMAHTLSSEPSVGIDKVRHVAKALTFLAENSGDAPDSRLAKVSYSLWGGAQAMRWASSIVRHDSAISVTAAAPPTPTDDTPSAPGDDTVLNDAQYVEEVLGGLDWDPDDSHPYLPDSESDNPNACQICGATGEVLVHAPESLGAPPTTTEQLAQTQPQAPQATPEALASYFAAFDTDSNLTALFARQSDGHSWLGWDPDNEAWQLSAEQSSSDVIPIDDQSAHTLGAMLLAFDAVPVPSINQDEWSLVDALPDDLDEDFAPPVGSLDDVQFGIRLEDSDLSLPKGLFVVDDLNQCWEWEPSGDWDPVLDCPDDLVLVDTQAAIEVASEIASETGLSFPDLEESFEQAAYIVARSQNVPGPETTPEVDNEPYDPDNDGDDDSVPGGPGDTDYDDDNEIEYSVIAAGPLIPDNQYRPPQRSNAQAYTPQERSANASKQFRDSTGKFARVGNIVHTNSDNGTAQVVAIYPDRQQVQVKYANGRTGILPMNDVTNLGAPAATSPAKPGAVPPAAPIADPNALPKIDFSKIRAIPRATSRTAKAALPYLLPPMSADALHQVIDNYTAFIEKERQRQVKSYAAMTPDNSDVKPLYMAVVDPMDKTAVTDLLALVPSSPTSTTPALYIREADGWVESPDMLAKMKSTAPPPVVALDDATYAQVLQQVDGFYQTQTQTKSDSKQAQPADPGGAAAASSYSPSLWDDYGHLLPATLTVEDAKQIKAVIAVAGVEASPKDVEATRRLHDYWAFGRGAAKIRWNTPGDWKRCHRHLAKYIGERSKGYCFTGDTEFTTRDGVMTFAEAAGTSQFVLTHASPVGRRSQPVETDGYWVQAPIRSFGEQPVLRVTLTRGGVQRVIRATPEHRWFVSPNGRNIRRTDVGMTTTAELLPGMVLPSLYAGRDESLFLSPDGIRAGIVFGDGSRHSINRAIVDLWGDKQDDLLPYFSGFPLGTQKVLASGVLGTRVYGLPVTLKGAPSVSMGLDHLYGWLAGYFAADGSIGGGGAPTLWSARRDHLELAKHVAMLLGMSTGVVSGRMRKGIDGTDSMLYHLTFARWSVPQEFLLRKRHREAFGDGTAKTSGRWTVVAVEDHGEVEEVFCATVPETESFLLTEGIWTLNCQKMHKEVTGVYTGSRYNVGGNGRSNRSGLRGDGSALLLSVPTRILGSTADLTPDQFKALVEVDVPTVLELANLRHRDYGHQLGVGERFLVDATDGIYAVHVLDPAQTLGWTGRPAALVQHYGQPTELLLRNEV